MIITPMAISPLAANLLTEFVPTDLEGIIWWYGKEFVVTASPDIDQWTDLTGNGNHAVQAVALDKPHLIAADIEGQDVANFGGVRQYFDTGSTYESDFQDDFVISMVVKINDGQPAAIRAFFGDRDGTDRIIARLNTDGTVQLFYNDGSNLANFISNDALSNGVQPYAIYTFWADFSGDGFLKIRKNGVNLASNGVQTGDTSLIVPGDFNTTENLYLGARNFNGVADRFAEYNGASAVFAGKPELAIRDINELENYLSSTYNIALG